MTPLFSISFSPSLQYLVLFVVYQNLFIYYLSRREILWESWWSRSHDSRLKMFSKLKQPRGFSSETTASAHSWILPDDPLTFPLALVHFRGSSLIVRQRWLVYAKLDKFSRRFANAIITHYPFIPYSKLPAYSLSFYLHLQIIQHWRIWFYI